MATDFTVEMPVRDSRGNVRRELRKPELPVDSYLTRDKKYSRFSYTNKAGKHIYVANWGVGLFAWPARVKQGLKPRQRTEQKLWSMNELVIIPKPTCEECKKVNMDGMMKFSTC